MKRFMPFAGIMLAALLLCFEAHAATGQDVANIAIDYFSKKSSAEEAIRALRPLAEDDGNDAFVRSMAYVNIANINKITGNTKQARKDIGKALSLEKNAAGYEVLAAIEAKEGHFKAAIGAIENAMKHVEKPTDRQENVKGLYEAFSHAADAPTLHKEFENNLFAAEEKYRGKMIVLRGKVASIGRAFNNAPELSITAGAFKEFSCELLPEMTPYMSTIKKGDTLYMACTLRKGGKAIVQLKDCALGIF